MIKLQNLLYILAWVGYTKIFLFVRTVVFVVHVTSTVHVRLVNPGGMFTPRILCLGIVLCCGPATCKCEEILEWGPQNWFDGENIEQRWKHFTVNDYHVNKTCYCLKSTMHSCGRRFKIEYVRFANVVM